MSTATHDNPMLAPRPPGGMAPGAALSLLVHGALIAALTIAVDWRTKTPETVSAELWSALPQIAAPKAEAPPPPAPAPAPAPAPVPPPPVVKEAAPPPDIAIEREAEKRRKEEQLQKQEQARKDEAARKKEEAAREKAAQAKAEEARLAKVRDEQMKRMFGSLQGNGNNPAGTAPKDTGPSRAYIDKLRALLRNSVIFPDNGGPNVTVEVRVLATASGTIMSHNIVRKSGNDEFDEAVQRGLDRLGTLPRDSDGRVPTEFIIVHRMRDQ